MRQHRFVAWNGIGNGIESGPADLKRPIDWALLDPPATGTTARQQQGAQQQGARQPANPGAAALRPSEPGNQGRGRF